MILLFFLLFLPFANPQAGGSPPVTATTTAPTDYTAESFVIQKYATDVTYAADGTGERLMTVQIKVQSESAVRQFGVLEIAYESRNEKVEFVYVRVRKADGSVVTTPDSDAQDQPAEVTRQAPFYSDIRNRQLPVKSLSAGDQLEYQVRQTRTVAAAPGHFWYVQNFLKDAVVLEETASLTVPRQKYVQVESPEVKPEVTEAGDHKVYRWKTSQLQATKAPDSKTKKPVIVEQPPSIAVTTFKDWQEVGRWYGDLQKDRVVVTPAIQAKASELVKGISGDEEKIAATYAYVATQYRYIGVAFGIGRYQPHSADDVMQNQYGDCKDKHTLLAALLKAQGYDAWPVLVGSQHVLQPNVPSPGQFDHVITAVTWNKSVLWMDATSEVAPFRMLFSGLRDKQVLAIPSGAAAVLMKTPANAPFDSFDTYDVKASLASDGTLTGHFDISLRGDDELIYRIVFHQSPRLQWPTLAQNISSNAGFAGTVTNLDATSPEKTQVPFHYSYDYSRKEFSDWGNRRILPLAPPLYFAYAEDDSKPADTILLGGPITYTFHTSIHLPDNYKAELPPAVSLKTAFAEYSAIYTQTDGNLIVEKKTTWKSREMPVAQWGDYIKFEKAVLEDENTFVQLIGSGVKVASAAGTSNPDAVNLIQQAFGDIQAKNYDSASQALDKAAKLSPGERGLWAGYGYLDLSQFHIDDGLKAYQKEIDNHPENFDMYRTLAEVQAYHKHFDDAVKTLQALLKAAPGDVKGHTQLASVLMGQKRYAEAVPVLEEAVGLSADDAHLKVMLGTAEISGGAKEKGASLLRQTLTATTDENILNDAAYELADHDVELPLARTSCEKALQLLDEKTAKITLSSLTDGDLRSVAFLGATWDTMGWVLYRQGEYEKALGYARGAWMLDQRPVIGTHLGQIYEKLNRSKDAIHSYQLAVVSGRGSEDLDIKEAEARLADLKGEPGSKQRDTINEELGKLRSTNLPKEKGKSGSADFFVLFSPQRVEDVQYLKGDGALRPDGEVLKKATFDVPFPASSGARIVRRGILYCSDVLKDCQFTMLLPENTRPN